jgi:hypothetical protein
MKLSDSMKHKRSIMDLKVPSRHTLTKYQANLSFEIITWVGEFSVDSYRLSLNTPPSTPIAHIHHQLLQHNCKYVGLLPNMFLQSSVSLDYQLSYQYMKR